MRRITHFMVECFNNQKLQKPFFLYIAQLKVKVKDQKYIRKIHVRLQNVSSTNMFTICNYIIK